MFKGRTVIITGGSSGIGKELALRLADRGAHLALVARDQDKLASVREQILSQTNKEHKTHADTYSCDVGDPEKVQGCMTKINETTGPPDILINSAGILSGDYFERLPYEDFRRLMDTNFFGTLNFIKAALPFFKQKGRGWIINICSLAGVMGVFGYSSYCASKFAVVGLTESLQVELKPQGIHVHLVLPPEVETPMLKKIRKERPPETAKLAGTTSALSASETAEAIIRGVERGRPVIIPGRGTGTMIKMAQLLPGLARAVVDYTVKKNYRGP